MSKGITVVLSDKAENYFNEVRYSLDNEDGKVATRSEVINHCLEELADFEARMEQDVLGWLRDNKQDIQRCLLDEAATLVGNPLTNISGSTDVACIKWQEKYKNWKQEEQK